MRTTVTLDEDVAAKLEQLVRQTGSNFKTILNETLREGLLMRDRWAPESPYRVEPLGPGVRVEFESASKLLEEIEGGR